MLTWQKTQKKKLYSYDSLGMLNTLHSFDNTYHAGSSLTNIHYDTRQYDNIGCNDTHITSTITNATR